MALITGKFSASRLKGVAYRRSRRAERRRNFAAVREEVRAAKPPPLLGPYTDILTVLAASGPVRRVAMHGIFTEIRVACVEKYIHPGICVEWILPGSDRRGARGRAVALNPSFPLYKEVRGVLRALHMKFPYAAEQDLTENELALMPQAKSVCQVHRMLGSANRLRILSALIVLGGKCRISVLASSVPGMRGAMVKSGIRSMITDGIAIKNGPWVSLAQAAWTPAFRRLLRAYVRVQSGLAARVRACSGHARATAKARRIHTFFGSAVTERALMLLAVRGPMRHADLEIAAVIRGKPTRLRQLVEDGVLVRILVLNAKANFYQVGLNAAHPIYRELRRLLCAMFGTRPARKKQLHHRMDAFPINRLFAPGQCGNILLALETAVHGWIDAASISRVYPEHDVGLLMRRLRQFTSQGLAERQRVGSLVLYRLSPGYAHYNELKGVLRRIIQLWPRYQTLAKLEKSLYVSSHQETAHANASLMGAWD